MPCLKGGETRFAGRHSTGRNVVLLVARVRGSAADRGDHADVTPHASRMLGSAFGGLNE